MLLGFLKFQMGRGARIPPKTVHISIFEDFKQPCPDIGSGLELLIKADCADIDILNQILGVRLIAAHSERAPAEDIGMFKCQRFRFPPI